MNEEAKKQIRPLFFLFILVNAFLLTGKSWMAQKGVSQEVLLAGNLLLFGVSLVAFWMSARSLRSPNPQAFVRAMYGSFLIKFFLLALVAFIYIMMVKKAVNKPALGICAVLYILYTSIEIRGLLRLLKSQKNA